MSKGKSRKLQAARIETAVNICVLHPNLYPTIRNRQYVYNGDSEKLCAQILLSLMKQEPCIRKILEFYYKRQ